jgi:trimeric autotransporter adhesin
VTPGGSGAGDLIITVGGDLSGFEAALDSIPGIAQSAFADVQGAIANVDWSDVGTGVNAAADSLDNLGTATAAAASDLADTTAATVPLADGLETAGSAATDAAAAVQTLPPALDTVTESATEAEGGLAGMAEQLVALGEALAVTEGLKALGEEALTAYGNIEQATISISALTGSSSQAAETIEGLETLATSDALSFPSLVAADQKMTALGFSAAQTNQIMNDAANAAAATGNSFDQVANAIDRMALSGAAGGRQLAALGISAQTLGAIMGTTATGVTAAFKALDQSDRLAVLDQALSKFAGDAALAAQSINGAWQNLKTAWDFVLEDLGSALAPVVQAIAGLISGVVLPAIKMFVDSLNALPGPMRDAVVLFGVAVVAIAPLSIALGGLALGLSAASGAWAAFTGTAVGGALLGGLTSIGEALVVVTTGATASSTAVALWGAAITTAGAAVAVLIGYQIGTWLYNQVPAMKELGDATADLGLKYLGLEWAINQFNGVSASQQALVAAANQLNQKLQAQGIIIQQGTMTTEQWSQALSKAAAGVPSVIGSLQQYNASVKTAADGENTLISNLKTAQDALQKITIAYNAGFASAGQYEAAVKAVDTAQTALNGSGLIFAQTMDQILIGFQTAATNAVTTAQNFQLVSNAFGLGRATVTQYTTALTQMVKAQEDANGGLISASNAVLVVQNAFRELQVASTNAATNVAATAAAVDAGTASWTQYVSALNALNAAQIAANGGLQDLGTAIALADVALQTVAIDLVNAQTNLKAVDIAAQNGTASFLQHVAAVNAVQAVYQKLGYGIMDAATAFQQAIDNQQLATVSFINLTQQVNSAYAAWKQTGQGLLEYLDLVAKLPGANEAANNGLISQDTALQQVQADHIKLANAVTNTNTVLGTAAAQFAKGEISLIEYTKYVNAAKAAQDAFNGSTAAAAATATGAATGITKVASAAQAGAAATQPLVNGMTKINGTWVDMTGTAQDLTTGMQKINGVWVDMAESTGAVSNGMVKFNGTWVDLDSGASTAATDLQQVNGELVDIAAIAPSAAGGLNSVAAAAKNVGGSGGMGGISGIGSAAQAATGQVQSLGAELDKVMGDLPGQSLGKSLDATDAFDSLNGASMSVNITPNTIMSTAPEGISPLGAITELPTAGNSTLTQDPFLVNHEILDSTATMSAAVNDAATATTSLTTAVTAATPAVVANYNQFGQLTDAAGHVISTLQPLALAATNATTAVTAAASATTASTAATAASTAAINALNSGAIAAATSIATIGPAAQPFVAALTGIGHILGVGGSQGTPFIGSLNTPYTVPTGGANGGVGGPNSALNYGMQSTVGGTGPSVNLNVNLSGSVLTGSNGMQQLTQTISAAMINQLARMGIRMTRG